MKTRIAISLIAAIFLVLSAGQVLSEEQRSDVLYISDCGNSVSTSPGNCHSGKTLKWAHVVRIEGTDAKVCTCAEGCKCGIDPKDASKCVCGNPLKTVSLKGKGIYFCNCGGSCQCNTVSDRPGKCKCGMDLKKAD